ncbi:endonuclease III [Gorillibacterium sp. sgz500922]|uniref:endonuclease III n=1 Tax=Gorillibacterium sp. sgz500922 TaxID=3446694 RepID=UPI003F665C20
MNERKIRRILDTMGEMFPEAHCELNHSTPFELLVAVMLSAQATDESVNRLTRHLFEKYTSPQDYLEVPLSELEQDLRTIGLFRNKAKNLQSMCRILIDEWEGQVPEAHEALVTLPGVGRKTANVVVSNAFGVPAFAVDTHVERVSKRLGLAKPEDSVLEVERKLNRIVPREEWTLSHHRFIFFGRYHCKAQSPQCGSCPLLDLCPEGKRRMKAPARMKAGANRKNEG